VAEKRAEVEESTADREIVLTRVFDAPRKMVWEAWTDLKQVALLWGPRGFSTTIYLSTRLAARENGGMQ
jgi:uncharacterized protein YndB with AHSA1/START domain